MILFYINNSALYKSQFFQQVLHDQIVPVRIHTKMITLLKRPVNTKASDPFLRSVTGKPMYHSIITAVPPVTIIDHLIVDFLISIFYP